MGKLKNKKINSHRKKVILIELAAFIVLILISKLSEYILNVNNLVLLSKPKIALWLGQSILLIIIIIQTLRIICNKVKSIILKSGITVVTIIAICTYLFASVIGSILFIEPEHIIEKDNKKMVACVNSFLQVRVSYYDYINLFVRGNKLRLYEDYGEGGYDPFETEEISSPKESTYYDDNGNPIKGK